MRWVGVCHAFPTAKEFGFGLNYDEAMLDMEIRIRRHEYRYWTLTSFPVKQWTVFFSTILLHPTTSPPNLNSPRKFSRGESKNSTTLLFSKKREEKKNFRLHPSYQKTSIREPSIKTGRNNPILSQTSLHRLVSTKPSVSHPVYAVETQLETETERERETEREKERDRERQREEKERDRDQR